jgi:signal transduction histidine kinase
VRNSANHLLDLINDVIDVSKIETGKAELSIDEFNLSALVQNVKDTFAIATTEKGFKMSLDIPEELVVKSDERRVKQIIVNLVSNAVKFTEKGEIAIRAAEKNGMVKVSVRDSGIGMKKDDIEKLFKAFSRISTEGRVIEGTGLGLYLSQKLAGLLGGEISAESKFGKGSTFTFTLPLIYEDRKM